MASRKPLQRQVMVVTGATSGIGLATVRKAAARGARVVLVARGESDLREICAAIQSKGGQATYAVADVGQSAEIRAAAAHAVATFGGFDTWVNVAGLTIYGALDTVPEADNARLMQTNFWGTVHGSLIAAEHFRSRPGGGGIINVGSVASDLAFPLQGMYAASKHAVKGFTDALRMELLAERAKISVTLLKPNSINSPLPQRARNYMEREPMLPPPIYEPEEVAHAILACAVDPVRELIVGGGGVPLIAFRRLAPDVYDRIGPAIAFFEKRRERASGARDALDVSRPSGQVRGTQPGYVMRSSLYTRAALAPKLPTGLLAIAVGTMLAGRRRSRRP